MIKPGSSVRPNSSLYNTKVTLSFAPHKKHISIVMGYIININAINCTNYSGLCYY